MKTKATIITIAFFLFICGKAQAQVYIPFPDSNAVWNVLKINVLYSPDSTIYNTVHYGLFGDTLINSIAYNKLYYNDGYIDSTIQITSPNTIYWGAMREENFTKKIFFIPKDSINEGLLYDFSISLSETVYVQSMLGITDLECVAISSVLINNQYRNVYMMYHWLYGFQRWIEGIGNARGLLNDYDNSLQIPGELLCFWENNNLIYQLDSFTLYSSGPHYDSIFYSGCYHNTTIITNQNELYFNKVVTFYPNPLTHSTLVSVPEYIQLNGITIDIFDVQGRKIKEFHTINNNQLILSRADFKTVGVYFVRIKSAQYLETIKLLVQ